MAAEKTRCPECGGRMAEGSVIDFRHSSAHPSEWIAGEITTNWIGTVKADERFEVAAYRCETCGYLKFYADKPARSSGNIYS